MNSSLASQTENDSPSVNQNPEPIRRSQGTFITYVLLAVGCALFIRFFIAAPYVVSGASMDPTFDDWHYLIVDRVSYRFSEPKRGDVIIFDAPREHGRSLIKRVIGLPGETVVLSENSITIVNKEHPEGFVLSEPYVSPQNLGQYGSGATLGEDEYFVLGDNRRMSSDSRIWGVLPKNLIVGRAFLRLYPLTMIDILPGVFRFEE